MKKEIILNETDKCYSYLEDLKQQINAAETVIILGNGGSSAIASHISQDYTKFLKKKSFTFSDASRLTCYTNDYGYDQAYLRFLKEFVSKNEKTLVILISSSGNSENILNCAKWCDQQENLNIITLSGFNEDNKLKNINLKNRTINYWVNSDSYGIVECVHMIFLHMVV